MELVLASTSPIRGTMLANAGVPYAAEAPGVDEAAIKAGFDGGDQALTLRLAEAKALAVAARHPSALVIGSDSLVSVDGRRFDKPAGRESAAEHLRFFSGKTMVLTSAVVLAHGGDIVWRHAGEARLQVRELSDAFIDSYLEADWPEGELLRRCVPARRAGRAFVRVHCRRPFHHPRYAAAAATRRPAGTRRAGAMTSGVPYAEVIGDPIKHSKSPLIHGFWLRKLGLSYDYRATRVTVADLPSFLDRRRADPLWCGCNITMPLKRAVLDALDEQSPEVRMIGAANTVTRLGRPGRFAGHNTDWIGVREPVKEWLDSESYFSVAVIGTGGAAAAAMVALRRPAPLHIETFGRSFESALAFRNRFDNDPDAEFWVDDIGALAQREVQRRDPSLLINASPLGMSGHPPLAIDLTRFAPGSIIFDMVYDPLETDLLRQARERGLVVIDGLQMLVAQAAAAFEHFFGEPPPREYDAELRELLTA